MAAPGGTVSDAATGRRRLRVVQVLGVVVVAVVVWWARGSLSGAFAAAGRASAGWLLLAAAAKAASMAGLARQQRRLIGGRRRPRLRSVLATAYAGNAISVALLLAGAGLSAAFTFRRYVAGGVPRAQVATGLAVSWAVATAAFTAVLAAAAAGTGHRGLLVTGVLGGVVSVAVVVGLALALRSPRARGTLGDVALAALPAARWLTRRPLPGAALGVRSGLDRLAATRLRTRDIVAAAVSALLLWTADIACLGFALLAVGARLEPPLLVLAWSAGIAATTFSLTPGGLGLVEAALTAALVAAGLPTTTTLAGVLLYRLVSFWLVAAIGAVVLAGVRRRQPAGRAR